MRPYPRHWLVMTIGVWSVTGAVLGGLPLLTHVAPVPYWLPWALVLTMASGACLSILLLWLSVLSDGWRLRLQLPLLIAGAMLLGLAQAAIDHTFFSLFRDEALRDISDWTEGIGFNFLFYFWILLLYVAGIKLLLAARERQAKEAEIAAEEAAAGAAALNAVRYQINPDVLFGTLGRASALVGEKRHAEAGQMVERLADFLRWSLTAGDKTLSSLGDELAALDAYFEIEAVRFGSRLTVTMDCHPGLLEVQTPSFLLQPLAEYLIRTGIAENSGNARIAISASSHHPRFEIVMRDDCPAADDRADARLAATRARLATLYGHRASLSLSYDPSGRALRLNLPLRLRGANNPSRRGR